MWRFGYNAGTLSVHAPGHVVRRSRKVPHASMVLEHRCLPDTCPSDGACCRVCAARDRNRHRHDHCVQAAAAAVPCVAVTARNVDTGFIRSTVTDAEGRYRIAAVPPGVYELTAELSGFVTNLRRGVRLSVGSEAVVNFEMAVGGVTEQVTVEANVPVIETTTSAVPGSLSRDQLERLPIAGRNFTNLLRVMPGAAANNSSFSFGGSRGRSNTWVVDGVHNTNEISAFQNLVPALDSIQEVQVLVNGFKAEYGQASGGIVNVITRAGTNAFRGNGVVVFQDNRLRA